MHKAAGFNLIELMIVIAITASLAAIAIPSYSRYLNKGRALSAVVLTQPVRVELTEYGILHHGDFSGVTNSRLAMPSDELVNHSKDVDTILITGQGAEVTITATLADGLGTLSWEGMYEKNNLQWTCTYS